MKLEKSSTTKLLKGCTIISLVGSQGSGKSTIGQQLADYVKTLHIEVSSVVKEAANVDGFTRDELYQTGDLTKDNPDWLGRAIEAKIVKWLPTFKRKTAVLTGVREREVHGFLRRQGARLHIFEIAADPHLRFKRLSDLRKVSSARQFLEMELKERELGLPEVIDQSKFKVVTREPVPPDHVMKSIHKLLLKRGVKCN